MWNSAAACRLLLLTSTALIAGTAHAKAPELHPFPDPPSPEERLPRNDMERQAGVVILEDRWELSAKIKMGFMGSTTAETRRKRFRRLLVLREGMAEVVERLALPMDPTVRLDGAAGMLLPPSGASVPLGQSLPPTGEADSYRPFDAIPWTGRFSSVEPGSVVDVAWIEVVGDVRDSEYVPLGGLVPIRALSIRAESLIFWGVPGNPVVEPPYNSSIYWYPLLLSAVAGRCQATLSPSLDLHLEARDLPATPWEPYSPPVERTLPTLVLQRITNTLIGGPGDREEAFQLTPLFGPPPPDGYPTGAARLQGPVQPVAEFDELGFQRLPSWSLEDRQAHRMLRDLGRVLKRAEKALKKLGNPSTRPPGESQSVLDRAVAVFDDVRSWWATVSKKVDEDDLLQEVTSAVALKRALLAQGIPARVIFSTDRMRPPWHPYGESYWGSLVEIETEDGSRHYLGAPWGALQDPEMRQFLHVGEVFLRSPDQGDKSWSFGQIPVDSRAEDSVTIESSADASVPVPGETVEVSLVARGWAAFFRIDFTEDLLPAGAEGALDEDPSGGFDVSASSGTMRWPLQALVPNDGGALPLLPPPSFLDRFGPASPRRTPFWNPYPTELTYRHTWRLPEGKRATAIEESRRMLEGPKGARFDLSPSVETAPDGRQTVVTELRLRIPNVLPAAEYEALANLLREAREACLATWSMEDATGEGTGALDGEEVLTGEKRNVPFTRSVRGRSTRR